MWDPEVASNITGYLSIVCWLIVFIPQLWENYERKSGDGLSMTFLVIWLAGDVFNLVGVILQDLLPTMFLLALWYTVADMGLIWQVIFYQRLSTVVPVDEEEVSLIRDAEVDHHPRLIRRSSESKHRTMSFWFNTLSGAAIVLVTLVSCAWYASIHGGLVMGPVDGNMHSMRWLPQLLGWTSAILYVGSRIPQIIKNYRQKSTEGLSLGMFLCAVLGNVLFTLSIFLRSVDRQYVLVNLAWIVGSCGTLVFDFTIFIQFFLYKSGPNKKTKKNPVYVE
ncbi:PQ loop repeat-domain-containing protein [Halteromyces radiatus]|uniref:PQ loop repeat-domain-containing protein n=1 Tax=Halteromyces radiatus TaxID=101107 RepID=UPI00221E9303|nr:PQ loop repeat-domain-containing protein [Halteromyces radiatus]KAI8096483.1 PQ loop repeat-domain-containing protein [Halteromyces radiatus]